MRNVTSHDIPLILSWLEKRGLKVDKSLIPPVGIIEDNCACGFIIHCDNNTGILDWFITNPDMPDDLRDQALDGITSLLIESAKRAGLKQIHCHTKIEAVKSRAERHGFFSLDSGFISLMKEI